MDAKIPSTLSKPTEPQPFFEQLQQEIEHVLERLRGYPPMANLRLGDRLSPLIDMAETEDAVEITAEIAGVMIDDLDVSLHGDTVLIKGEKSQERTKDEKDYHLHERSYGKFQRQIPLGFTPAEDAVAAHFKDGLLKLKITKPPEAKKANHKITVKAD